MGKPTHGPLSLSKRETLKEKSLFQKYLLVTRFPHHRKALTRLRTSSHILEIERGRYKGLKRFQRVCPSCNVLEDEIHFLDSCTLYKDIRHNLLKQTNHLTPSNMINDDSSQMVLANFVYKCFVIRGNMK